LTVVTKPHLLSKHFSANAALEDCLHRPSAHVLPGSRGDHVSLIQSALIQLGLAVIGPSEIAAQFYGETTKQAVLKYKGPPRNIINKTYQQTPDNIVGQMTIDRLDDEMFALENRPPPKSFFVSTTSVSPVPHNHLACPPNNPSPLDDSLGRCHHHGTPINPLGSGRKINIGGEGETDYLGFEDFVQNRFSIEPRDRPLRPLTKTLPDHCASDICMRFSPISNNNLDAPGKDNTERGRNELVRIAAPGCRFTICGLDDSFLPAMRTLGIIIEEVREQNFLSRADPKPIITFVMIRL
jgi:hypothetical protein